MAPVEMNKFYQLGQRIHDGILEEKGMDDGRGKNIPANCAYEVGLEIGRALTRNGQEYFLLSGDGRKDTPRIMDELSSALVESGINVIYAGAQSTTPLFEVERGKLGISGANVTASHQDHEYNGIKIIYDRNATANTTKGHISEGKFHIRTQSEQAACYDAQEFLRDDYITQRCEDIGDVTQPENTTIVYDAMQGVSYSLFEKVAEKKGISVLPFRQFVDPYFARTVGGPDPSNPDNVPDYGVPFNLAILVDGDGDRCGIATQNGLVPTPYFSVMRARALKEEHGDGVFVAEYALASVIREILEPEGIEVIGSKRGRKNLIASIHKESDKQRNVLGGAEIGLHNFDKYAIDDGLMNAFEFIKIAGNLSSEGRTIDDEVTAIANSCRQFWPEIRVKSNEAKDDVYSAMSKSFENASSADGIIYDQNGIFWNIRGSSNANEFTLNINATNGQTLEEGYQDLQRVVEINFPKLSEAFDSRKRELVR